MNDYYVYALRRSDSLTPFYIGMGRGDRAKHHLDGRDGNPNSHKNNTIKKALREGATIEIDVLFYDLSREEAIAREIETIALYGRSDLGLGPLTNLTDGGECNQDTFWTPERRAAKSEEVRAKMADPEHRKLISENTKAYFKNEANRLAVSSRTKEQMSRPGMLEKLAEKKRQQWADPQYREMILSRRKEQKRYICTQCGKENILGPHFARYHGDKCKRSEVMYGR